MDVKTPKLDDLIVGVNDALYEMEEVYLRLPSDESRILIYRQYDRLKLLRDEINSVRFLVAAAVRNKP